MRRTNPIGRTRPAALCLPALVAAALSSCLMSHQYRAVRGLDDLAGDRRFDPSAFAVIDRRAIDAPDGAAASVETLSTHLGRCAEGDLEKARLIWRWITAHIAYDVDRSNYSPAATLRDRRGTCQGYAELFVLLARRMGLAALEITGYGRGTDYRPGDRVRDDHAWNAVRISGRWHLLDCTYGAGYVRGGRFVRSYREHYFCAPPSEFIHANLPALRRWQLLRKKISRKEFERLPYYRHGYFTHGLKQTDANTSCVIPAGRSLVLEYEAPPGVFLIVKVRDMAGTTVSVPRVSRTGSAIRVEADFPGPGRYHLIGWAGASKNPKGRDWAFTYLVQAGALE